MEDTKTTMYHAHLHTIAMTVSKANRFQPVVHWTPEDWQWLEYTIVDTAKTDEDGEPVTVAQLSTMGDAIRIASEWSRVPERASNDWTGVA